MNLRTILCSFSGLIFCLVLFSLAQNVNSEVTINIRSYCNKYNGTVGLEDLNSAILKYDEHWPLDCEISLASRSWQSVVISFYYWNIIGSDELVFRDAYTELSLTNTKEWYGEKTFIFRGLTTIHFSTNGTDPYSLYSSKFKFLFTVSNADYPRCEKYDFVCNNKICLSGRHLACDENNNCGDWSDEIDCERMCTSDEFECANRKCIPKYKLCNDKNDCGDMSDEEMCSRDCRLGDQFKCSNSMCISNQQVCDNKNDCGDWSDEINCHRECDFFQFPCRNKKCIDHWKVCDGNNDCGDRSDEKNCRFCSSLEFSCSNGLCIPKNMVCNNRNDCGDSSDEKHCNPAKRDKADQTKVTVVQFHNPWLITIIVCAVVLAIVIITFVGIYLRNRLKNQKKPPTTQPPNVPTNTNAQNAQQSSMFGHVSQPFRSERQSVPSSIQQPPAVPGAQAHQVPSMYPQVHSDTENRNARQVPPTNFFQRVRQSFRSEHQSTSSTVQPPGHTEPTSVASGPQTYQVPSMYPHLQSGVDNPEFKAEE